ncbi:hypothetical protein ACIP5Y_36525 [Nocardia sp. NPDC088792]|uniref:hypothetical protein n=1 Tax=Nocardia sp. NPDC088792 TaxID=3364332 RepID=UPI00382C128B
MSRTSGVCLALLALTITLSACGSSTTTAGNGTSTAPSATAPASSTVTTPAAAQTNTTGDACTEVQYEIDLAHSLQQGREPSDPQAAIQRLSAFRRSAPTEIIANFAQGEAAIVGHLQHLGQDQINTPATDAILGKLSQWKSSHC